MWPQDSSSAGPSSSGVPPSRSRNQHTDDAATCLVRKPDGFTFTHEQLNQLFADFKPIHDIREVRAGFFVVLDSPEVAQQAINKLHNRQLGPGWLMRVERAKVREWPFAPGATQRVAPEAPGPFPSFGGALSSNNPNLSPIGTRKPASEVMNETPRVPAAVALDSPRQMPSSSLFIQGLPLSASWQSLKDWSLTGHPESRMMKPFVDVWCQGAEIEGRLGFRTPDIAAAAKHALERWPYEGRNLTITYHSQIQKLLHKEPIETREYAAQDEPRDFDVPRKRPRSPEPPYAEETEEDPQLLLDLEFARQRGHHLRKEDLLDAPPRPADDAPLPAKKPKSQARAAPKTTAEEDKLAEALRILKEMEQAAKPAASYDWGTGKVVYGGSTSPEKVDGAAPSSKTNTPALTFDDTASSFASPAKYEVGSTRGGRESRPSAAAWTYDEDAVVHRKPIDVPDVLQDPFQGRLFPQAQGRRDAGWGSKAAEPRLSPPEVRVVEKSKDMELDSARNGYAAPSQSDYAAPSQSDLFAQQHEGKKRAGFPVDMSRGFPQDEMRGFPDFSRRVPCRYFPNCRRGDSCAFLHNPEPQPALPFRDPAFMRQANDEAWGAYDERRDDAYNGWGVTAAVDARNGDESGWHMRKEGERRSSRETEGSRWHQGGDNAAAAAASSSAAGWGESTPPPRAEPAKPSPPAPAPARTEEEKRSDERREARRAERLQRQAGLLPPTAGRSSSATLEQVSQPPVAAAAAATSQAPAATDAAVSQPPTAATAATAASPTASKSQEAPAQPEVTSAPMPLPKLKFKLKLKEPSQVEPPKAVQPLAETQQQQPKPLEEASAVSSVPDKNDKAKSEVTAALPEEDEDDQLCQIDKVCMATTKKEDEEIEIQKVIVAPSVVGGKEESPWAY